MLGAIWRRCVEKTGLVNGWFGFVSVGAWVLELGSSLVEVPSLEAPLVERQGLVALELELELEGGRLEAPLVEVQGSWGRWEEVLLFVFVGTPLVVRQGLLEAGLEDPGMCAVGLAEVRLRDGGFVRVGCTRW